MPSAARKCRGSVVGSASACAIQAASHATVPSVRFFGWKMPLFLRVWGRRTTGGGGDGAATTEGTIRVGEDRLGGVDEPGDEDVVVEESAGPGDTDGESAGPGESGALSISAAGSANPGDSGAASPSDGEAA